MKKSNRAVTAGRVVGLWRYPVKSMGAETLTEAQVSWHGIAGDRRWAFIRSGVEQSGFPWLTLRNRADMNHYRPFFTDLKNPDTSPPIVKTPSGAAFDVTDPALGAELFPGGVQIIRQSRGIFDTFPLSLITTQTIARLEELIEDRLDVQRFRPNILVESSVDVPFAEDKWVGNVLSLGSLRMRVDKRDGRCVIITQDPDTGERNPAILRTVVDERQGCLGVYGTVVEPGSIALNDAVQIEKNF